MTSPLEALQITIQQVESRKPVAWYVVCDELPIGKFVISPETVYTPKMYILHTYTLATMKELMPWLQWCHIKERQ